MSFLTPVYYAGKLKGVVMVDINKENLKNIFYTSDRPLVWRYLNVTLSDINSGKEILVHQSENNLFSYVHYQRTCPAVYASPYRLILCTLLSPLESIRLLSAGDNTVAEYGQNAFSAVSQRHA